MNLKRYTKKAQEAVLAAQQLAEGSHHPQIDPEHLLHALVAQADGVVPSVLRQMGADPTRPDSSRRSASTSRRVRRPMVAPNRGSRPGCAP